MMARSKMSEPCMRPGRLALTALLASAVLAMTACEPVDLIGVTAEPSTATTTEPTASTRPALQPEARDEPAADGQVHGEAD